MVEPNRSSENVPTWVVYFLLFGIFLTVRGYHSRDGDQAYRLPLLLHRQDPALYRDDPFVRAFDTFNPHWGYLALLDGASRLVGLSAALAGLYALMYGLTCLGLDRLARAVWPELGRAVGFVAVSLVLLARAGNIGTNHLFEPMLLDRGLGFALGWVALAEAIGAEGRRTWVPALAVGLAALVHPALGLQLAMLLAVFLGVGAWGRKLAWRSAWRGWVFWGLALAPALGLHGGQAQALFPGLPAEEFRLLTAYVQSPQHMLPHLWRTPQWLAWAAYFGLAGLAMARQERWPAARTRLVIAMGLILGGLAMAWVAIEPLRDVRVTLFQPFRMATVARGLALVALAGRVVGLWRRGDAEGRLRAGLLGVGLVGDWTFVVVALSETTMTIAAAMASPSRILPRAGGLVVLAMGLVFLARHDTELGHERLLGAIAVFALSEWCLRRYRLSWTLRRWRWAVAAAWTFPVLAMVAPGIAGSDSGAGRWVVEALARRCRFGEVPIDAIERLALWCREHTPASARFIGPPGPKTFRLWSRRSLAFNRAAVPYHAAGLADWAARFRDHVGFVGSTAEFAQAYLADRQGLERRYERMSARDLAALAVRQGAAYVLAPAPRDACSCPSGPLELLHVEGRYAVYRVKSAGPPLEKPRPVASPASETCWRGWASAVGPTAARSARISAGVGPTHVGSTANRTGSWRDRY
jgi:hypothetical protein